MTASRFSHFLYSTRRLVLYPNGNKRSNGSGYISLYLEIEKTENFSLHWEVNVDFKLFVFDQIRDQYLAIKDIEVPVRRFYEMKKEWGFSQLLSQETFKNGDNGYLVEDCCIFGAELLIIEPPPELGQLSMIKNPSGGTIRWKIENFSLLDQKVYYSPVQSVGDIKWYLMVYPKGHLEGEGTHFSCLIVEAELLLISKLK
ncbi:hypothetical protein V6N12_045961 [Hibiscus sabdariffa]|uniref:MATH domain-containing protein n=1 Tax=Hibiscus sabdariffa TaxID=183260 RepID=A0ABR2G4R4_9ROSI